MKNISYKTFSWRTHQKNWRMQHINVCQFEMTFGCGLHCRHCYTDCYNIPGFLTKELNTREVKFVLDKAYRAGAIWLCLTGGDPLTRKDFLDIYAYAKDKGFIVTIFTNAYSMTAEIAAYFQKKPPFVIEMTLNAVNQATYEKISRTKGSFEKVMNGIELIQSKNLPLKIKTQVTKDNWEEVPDIIGFLKKNNMPFRPSYDLFARLNGDTAPCDLRVPPDKLFKGDSTEHLCDDCQSEALETNSTRNDYLFRCAAGGGDGINIDPYGNAFLCNLIRKPAVNLLESDIAEAFNKLLPLARGRVFTTDSKCRSCDVRDYCRLCPGRAFVETGDMEAPVEYYCQLADLAACREPAANRNS
ncbi:MAG: radical SAM protein [Candidatus Omnitrophica bacterium]|nr:radical SAM protein [Candidatus Omnitrophota bacterium]